MTVIWKRRNPRIYFGTYGGDEDCALVFGAPGDMMLWCWVVWKDGGRQGHIADYEHSFKRAKAAAEKAIVQEFLPGFEGRPRGESDA